VLLGIHNPGHVNAELIRTALSVELERCFENQKHLGGNEFAIGYQSVALIASRS